MGHFKWWGAVGALALLTHCASGTKDGADLPVADTEEEVLEKEELGQTEQALEVAPYNYSVDADATVDPRQPDTSFGQGIRVTVDGSPERRGYVRFQVRGLEGRVTRATLRFFAKDPAADGPALFSTANTWSEDTLTWNNAPPLQGSALADVGAVPDDSWVEYDVTAHVLANGEYSFALVSGAVDGTVLVSNESTLLSRRPLLSVWTDTPCEEGGATTASCSYKGDGLGGGTTLWRQAVGGPGDEYLSAMGSNGGDDFMITGSFRGAGSTYGGGTLPGDSGMALARYRADGSVLWSRGFNNMLLDATGVAVTSTAHGFVVGYYSGTPDLGTGPLPEASPFLSNMYLAKFGPDGRTLWSRGFGAWREVESSREASAINPRAVAADARGNVVVMGVFYGYVDFGGGTLFSGANPTGGDELAGTFIVKFSGDGNHLWSKVLPSSSTQPTHSLSLAVDEQGHVLVGGQVARGTDLGDGPVQSVSSHAPFVVKFSPEGTWEWKRVLVGASGEVRAVAMAGGNVFFTGPFSRSFTFAGQTYAQTASADIFLGSLGPNGEERWMRQLGTAAMDHARSLVVTSTGAVVLSGLIGWQTDLGGGVLRSGPFLASYQREDGAHRWSRSLSLGMHHELCAVGPGEVVHGSSFANTVRIDGEPVTASGADLMLLKLRP